MAINQRSRIRIEIGLISSGNQEVIDDKLKRVDKNGIVICDKLGTNTQVIKNAETESVELIQVRNNQPLVQLFRYLSKLGMKNLIEPPTSEEDIRKKVNSIPENIFSFKRANL